MLKSGRLFQIVLSIAITLGVSSVASSQGQSVIGQAYFGYGTGDSPGTPAQIRFSACSPACASFGATLFGDQLFTPLDVGRIFYASESDPNFPAIRALLTNGAADDFAIIVDPPDPEGYPVVSFRWGNENNLFWLSGGKTDFQGAYISRIGLRIDTFELKHDFGQYIGPLYEVSILVEGSYTQPVPPTRIPRPPYPIVFLHGLCSSPGTWSQTTAHLEEGGWKDGGTLSGVSGAWQLMGHPADADFYRLDFDDPPISQGLETWGYKVRQALVSINGYRASHDLPSTKFIVVAHSAGGLAARAYMQLPANSYANDVFHLITYGTPHSGTSLALLGRSPCEGMASSQGVDEMSFVSAGPISALSPFLSDLNARDLPANVTYTSLVGLACVLQGDCVVSRQSQDLSHAVASLDASSHAALASLKWHLAETGDYTHILEAINRQGILGVDAIRVRVASPVDISVTTPDGHSLSKSIPAVGLDLYEEFEDADGQRHDTVTIPLATPGTYTINVSPETGASPDDVYSLFIDRNGETTILASNVAVRDIPSSPYRFETVSPRAILVDIAPGNQIATLNTKSRGTTPIAILSTPGFDAVANISPSSLTFGRTGFEHTLHKCNSEEDANNDGMLDLVCHFRTADTDLRSDNHTAFLRGHTTNGTLIAGSDAVRILP